MFRESSSVFRAPYGFGHKEVGGSNPSSPTNSLCLGSSDGSEAEKSTSRHRLGSSDIEHFAVEVVEEQGSTLISMPKKQQKGRWFESIPKRQITLGSHLVQTGGRRKCTSIRLTEWIARGAWLGIHDLVGGSIPSLGTHYDGSIRNVCGCKHSPLQDNATFSGKQAKAVRLAVSNSWEAFGRRGFESFPSCQYAVDGIRRTISIPILQEKYYD